LKPSDIKPYSSLNIFWISPSQEFLNLNKYLDWKVIHELNRKKRVGISLNPVRYDTTFDKQELHDILIEHQDKLCPICFKLLSHNSVKELDHEPTIWNLRENIWEKLLELVKNQTNSKGLQVRYKLLLNLPRALVNGIIVRELESSLFVRSVHKNCHKTIDRDLSNKEKQWRSNMKRHLNIPLFKAVKKLRDSIKTEIKKYRKLTKPQIKEISSKRNLS
jgi:hypothetical protein